MAIGRRRGGKSAGKCLKERCMDRPGVVKQRHRSERKRRECGCSIFPGADCRVFLFYLPFAPAFLLSCKFFTRIYPTSFSTRSKNTLRINECSLRHFFFSLRRYYYDWIRLLFPFRNGIRQSYLYVCVLFQIKRKNCIAIPRFIEFIYLCVYMCIVYVYKCDSIKSRSRI